MLQSAGETGVPGVGERDEAQLSAGRRYYVLAVLTLVATVNFLDRQLLTILLEPIRKDLQLSDTQIGFVTGIAFAAIYVTLGVPVARLADRWSRRKVIAIAVTFWSVATACCGLATNFVQLFLARFGVGVGEAGGTAPSQALISDLFPARERATAMAILFLATPIGTALGMLWGGWAVTELGWRGAFFLAGIPGVILGLLVLFTVPEARKGLADGAREPAAQPPLGQTLKLFWSIRTFRYLALGAMLQTFLALGLSAWVPSFLARTHGFSPAQIGASLALIYGVAYSAGGLIGGRVADLLTRRDPRLQFWVAALTVLLSGAAAVGAFLGPAGWVFPLLALQFVFSSFFSGPLPAIVQSLVPVNTRATAAACMLFVINLFAIGLGPQALGIASDLLKGQFGDSSLRMALASATIIAIPAAVLFWRASVSYLSDLDRAEAMNRGG